MTGAQAMTLAGFFAACGGLAVLTVAGECATSHWLDLPAALVMAVGVGVCGVGVLCGGLQ
jgi:hypothetical protein